MSMLFFCITNLFLGILEVTPCTTTISPHQWLSCMKPIWTAGHPALGLRFSHPGVLESCFLPQDEIYEIRAVTSHFNVAFLRLGFWGKASSGMEMGLGVLPKEPANEGPRKTLAKDMKCEKMRRKTNDISIQFLQFAIWGCHTHSTRTARGGCTDALQLYSATGRMAGDMVLRPGSSLKLSWSCRAMDTMDT